MLRGSNSLISYLICLRFIATKCEETQWEGSRHGRVPDTELRQAHYSRLPRDLQTRLKNGGVKSFEHLYHYIASADIE